MPPRFGFRRPAASHRRVALHGLSRPIRIAHLTDLHAAYATPVQILNDAAELANAARPDLVVLTGDYVGYGTGRLRHLLRALQRVRAPMVAVLGNHDHWTDATAVAAGLDRVGVDVLINGWARHGELTIVGVDDGVTGHARPDEAVQNRPAGPCIGLSHDPEVAPDLWARGVPFVLSGHTHGGQIRTPLTDAVQERVFRRRYLAGLYEEDGGAVYVNAGVGQTGMPLRMGLGALREVAVFDFVPAG